MNRRPVSSSNIASVGFEQGEGDEGTLEVEFRSGHIYRYSNVPTSTFRQLVGASSAGKYLNQNVVGVFEEERVS